MKKLLYFALAISGLLGACKNDNNAVDEQETVAETPNPRTLNEDEKVLINSLDFNEEMVATIRTFTNAPVVLWKNQDTVFGLKVKMINSEGIELMKQQENFMVQGYYMLFLGDPTLHDVTIGLTREKNISTILHTTNTMGTSEFPENATSELAKTVEAWNKKGDLLIYGAGKDWLKLKIYDARKDQTEIATYLVKTCPDMAKYYGGADGIRKNMDSTGIVDFWWE